MVDFWRLGVNILVDLLVSFLMSMVHCMSGISFGCIVWCPSAFTCLPGLESFPLGSSGLFHMFIPPPGFTTPTVWPSCATHLLSFEQSSLDVVPDILSGPISYTCRCAHMQVEDLLEVIACLRVFKLPNFEARGELALAFGGTSILMSHTRSWCCRATSSPGITFTSVTSLRMVLWKRMKSICVAMFTDLYVMRWLSHSLKHVFPRSRSNAGAYSRNLSPSTSGSGLPYPIPPCTSLYPVPAWPTWPFQSPHGIRNSDAGILAVTARSWSKNRSLTSSLRPLCGAYTDRKVTTHWPTMSLKKPFLKKLWDIANASICLSIPPSVTISPPKTLDRPNFIHDFPLMVRVCESNIIFLSIHLSVGMSIRLSVMLSPPKLLGTI